MLSWSLGGRRAKRSLIAGLDCKMYRRLAALGTLPHRRIGGLDIAREARGVEQRENIAVAQKLGFERSKQLRFARELERQSLVIRQRPGHQLGEADRAEKTCRHPPGEGRADAGQDR